MENGEIKLKVLDIIKIAQSDVSIKISEKHIGGYQVCLYDDELYKKNADRTRLDKYLRQMKAGLHAMAIHGNSLNNHGFAFLWKDKWDKSLAPYSITLLNFAPFQSIERFLHLGDLDLPDMVKHFMHICAEFTPIGHSNSLERIKDYGAKFLNDICSPRPEGFLSWDSLKAIMLPRADLIAFEAWGIFGETFMELLAAEYSKGNSKYNTTSPELGLKAIDELIDYDYKFVELASFGLIGGDE